MKIQEKIQDLILKDLVSARDEATPPEFKELVERYYEVLSKEAGASGVKLSAIEEANGITGEHVKSELGPREPRPLTDP